VPTGLNYGLPPEEGFLPAAFSLALVLHFMRRVSFQGVLLLLRVSKAESASGCTVIAADVRVQLIYTFLPPHVSMY
jgi:hypothetical protein